MKLSCPNCGVAHDTSDYPNAFEINCVCGYSILVPTDLALSQKTITTFDKASPSAMDAEDDAILIRPEGLLALDSAENEAGKSQGVLNMTPAEQLPPGMVYDSFELPSSQALDLGNQDVFGESVESMVPPTSENPAPNLTVDSLEQEPEDAASIGTKPIDLEKKSDTAQKTILEKNQSEARVMVQRVQMSSMGQFLGRNYRLTLEEVTPQQHDFFMSIVGRMLRERPWLESECKKRGIDFKKEIEQGVVEHVPELIALEIYLASFKIGLACKFETME